MNERTTVTQVVQVGIESTPGTAVAAGKKLPSISIDPAVKANIDSFRPLGNKYPTVHALGKEWSTSKISGEATYSELGYLLSTIIKYAAPVQEGATTAYTQTLAPSSTGEDTIKTLTVERGSAVQAEKITYGIVTDLSLSGDRDNVELSGMLLGQEIATGITLTSSPTSLEQIPILPKDVSIYLDPDSGDLGTTKLTRVLKWGIDIKGVRGPLWVVDAAQDSWAVPVELPVQAQVKLLLEADAAGIGLLTPMRDGTSRFCRIEAISDQEAGTSEPYTLLADFALQVATEPSEFRDEDGVYAMEWTFNVVHDATWAKAQSWALTNKVSAL